MSAEISPPRSLRSPAHGTDPVLWANEILDFCPDPHQTEVLRCPSPRLLLCCTRQWVKSALAALRLLHFALFQPKSLAIIVSACGRQSEIAPDAEQSPAEETSEPAPAGEIQAAISRIPPQPPTPGNPPQPTPSSTQIRPATLRQTLPQPPRAPPAAAIPVAAAPETAAIGGGQRGRRPNRVPACFRAQEHAVVFAGKIALGRS